MKTEVTFQVSHAEMLDALTAAIEENFKYSFSFKLPEGKVVAFCPCDGGFRVYWGKAPIATSTEESTEEPTCKPCCSTDSCCSPSLSPAS